MPSLKNKLTVPLAALALLISAGGGYVTAAHADTTTATPTTQTATGTDQQHQKPAAVGTVTAVNGDIITLTDSHAGGSTTATPVTYTIDATNATIDKFTAPSTTSGTTDTTATPPARPTPTVISVSDIAVGDTLMVQGTVSGTNITATQINDGMPMGGRGGFGGGPGGPGVHGTVTAVNGTTLTVTGSNGTVYTVDGSDSTASKVSSIAVSDIAVGDEVGIDGSVSGTTVTAKNIMDGIPAKAATSASATDSSTSS